MEKVKCLIDGTLHDSREDLHKYLRKIRMKPEVYYHVYYPRYDLYSKELIEYKNPEKYFETDFNSKDNLKSYLKTNKKEGFEWAKNWLKNRKEKKNLKFELSQVELHSLFCPTRHYYDFFGGYTNICEEIGFSIRFPLQEIKINNFPDNAYIIEDTREKLPLTLHVETKSQKLNCGDYSLDKDHDNGIYIERKSMQDFINTLSDRKIDLKSGQDSNLARFSRELERAKETGGYIIMLVEECIENVQNFDKLSKYKKTKVSPAHIFKNLRDLLTEYPENFQVLFLKDREEMSKAIITLLSLDDQVKHIDLQWAYEKGILKL